MSWITIADVYGVMVRRCVPPMAEDTIRMLEERGHAVTVRLTRGGSLRYKLDDERERTALALSNRLRRLHGVG